jgi:hypothetical protein
MHNDKNKINMKQSELDEAIEKAIGTALINLLLWGGRMIYGKVTKKVSDGKKIIKVDTGLRSGAVAYVKENFKSFKPWVAILLSFMIPMIFISLAGMIRVSITGIDNFLLRMMLLLVQLLMYPVTIFAFIPILAIMQYIQNRAKLKEIKENEEQQAVYINAFQSIGFKDRIGNYPLFMRAKVEGEKETYTFKSNLNYDTWLKSKKDLETVLDTNIIKFEQGKSKQVISLDTTRKEISEFVEWDESKLKPDAIINLGINALEEIKLDMDILTSTIISGAPGSGKSVLMQSFCIQQLQKEMKFDLPEVKLYFFDGKGVDFKPFEKYAKGYTTDVVEFDKFLDEVVEEYKKRKTILASKGCMKVKDYNKKCPGSKIGKILVLIDEISLITDKQGLTNDEKKEREPITRKISDLARLARMTDVHIIIGSQVPNKDTVPGQIKNVCEGRVSGRQVDDSASRIILGNSLALEIREEIKGRMILPNGIEFQSYFVNVEKELMKIPMKPKKGKKVELNKEIQNKEVEKMITEAITGAKKEEVTENTGNKFDDLELD